MQLKIGQICRPDQCRNVLREAKMNVVIAPFTPDRRCSHPFWTMARAALLIKKFPVHALRIAFQSKRAFAQVRQKRGSNAHIVVNHLPLGESGCGIKHLVEIGKLQLLAFNFNH